MKPMELRSKLHEYIDSADDRLLHFLHAIFERYNHDDKIVAHTIGGKPLTKEEYIKRVLEADEAIERGEFTTIEDLEKQMKNW